jgi:hypothetical protein
MATPEVEGLLKDARLVIDYAARAGRLPDDTLPKAVAAVEQASTADALPETASLVTALNAAVRAIAPMTLIELRAGRSPFEARSQKAPRILLLCVLPCILVGLVYYTQLLHQEETAVKALQQIQDARPLDKLNTVRRMAELERVLEKRDSHYDQYHRAITELRDLHERIWSVSLLVQAAADRADWDSLSLFRWLFGNSSPSQPQPSSTAAARTTSISTTEAGAQPLSSGAAVAVEPAIPVPATATQNGPSDPIAEAWALCARAPSASSTGSGTPEELNEGKKVSADNPWFCGVLADLKSEFLFATILKQGLKYSGSMPFILSFSYTIQADMAKLNGWVLPLLYGLLGASVFLMRNLLDPRTANTDLFSSLLRIALGGIAGIVIGWFWVPAPSKGAELVAITSVPFALAFLAGFSIDMLFSLLDRLNRTISDEPGRGTPPNAASSNVVAPSPTGVPQEGQ